MLVATWTQNYTPVWGSLILSAIVAALPVVILLGLLAIFRLKAHIAALSGLAAALAVAVWVYGMPPAMAGMAALDGAAYGLFPIGWIVLCAIFVYDITVATGRFEILKESIAHLASDRRIQAIMIAFCFGGFVEGAAGFGTPVAISAAMLIGLGFKPLNAAGLSLIGNTAPVAFGALGTPLLALAGVTGLPLNHLSAVVGQQLSIFALIVPFWLVWMMAGFRPMLEVWPACLTAGGTFAIVQLLVSNLHGPWLVGIGASLASLSALVFLLSCWQPRRIWRFAHEVVRDDRALTHHSRREHFSAWLPWAILSAMVFLWGIPAVKTWLDSTVGFAIVKIHVPLLDRAVIRNIPIVAVPRPEEALFTLNWLSATGTGLFISGVLSGLLLGLGFRDLVSLFLKTLRRVRVSLLTIAAMLALGHTVRYAGLDASLGLAFAATGVFFPFFSPLLGWLGVALTGSDTSSNVLFGNLQQITARTLGMSPLLAAAANSSGGVMGKMIDAQSIVVAGVATGQHGGEGSILRFVFWHSLVLASLVGLLVTLQAYRLLPISIP